MKNTLFSCLVFLAYKLVKRGQNSSRREDFRPQQEKLDPPVQRGTVIVPLYCAHGQRPQSHLVKTNTSDSALSTLSPPVCTYCVVSLSDAGVPPSVHGEGVHRPGHRTLPGDHGAVPRGENQLLCRLFRGNKKCSISVGEMPTVVDAQLFSEYFAVFPVTMRSSLLDPTRPGGWQSVTY